MKYAIQIDFNNRIEHATFEEYVTPVNAGRYILVDTLPTGETEKEQDITNYLYIDKKYVYDPKPDQSNVPVAPRNVTEGEYITVNGVMYKAIANIPNGEPIIEGKNVIETTIEAQLLELKGE